MLHVAIRPVVLLFQVLFALFEKDVAFKPKLVSLFSGQHNEPWYIRLNPGGLHVPVLNHRGVTILNPAEIIDYISRETQSAGMNTSQAFYLFSSVVKNSLF